MGLLDRMTDIAESIDEVLHALAIHSDGGIALHHGVEVVADEDHPGLLGGAKEAFNGE